MNGVRVKVHPLAPVMLLLSLLLGEAVPMAAVVTSATLHELGHALAARCCGVQVRELELMPCGGAVRFDNVWRMRPDQLLTVALAGPAVNLLLAILAGAAGAWGWLRPPLSALLTRVNLVLMTFNMLPALPLDGGRILCALLMERVSPARAVKIGVRCGRALGIALCGAFLVLCAAGVANLSLAAAGLYLILSGRAEQRGLSGAVLSDLLGRSRALTEGKVLPVRLLAVSGECTLSQAAARMTPGCLHRFLLVGEDLSVQETIEEKTLLRGLMGGKGTRFCDLQSRG